MNEHTDRPVPVPVAVVGLAAIMPDAPDATSFWQNLRDGRYSISDVPPERWDPELYYDPDPAAPDKTYSRIGGWVREHPWEPQQWRLPIPPKVAAQFDVGQQWAVSAARSALLDAGWPQWGVDPERVAVILGNAIGGDKHYRTSLRVQFPEFARDLREAPSFTALPGDTRTAILDEWHERFLSHEPAITEDTMPGELSNVLAGRIANLFDLRGPNFTTDAACASALAATSAAVQGLAHRDYDAVVTGGIDRNMGVYGFVKFCKIGALSATGTRPFDAGADGFVMGEGASLLVLKRLADAERDGDRVYAVLLGLGGASDGKGKGITAPNPAGQRLAVERAWANAGLKPGVASAVEAHGTSTRVGDAAELKSLGDVFGRSGVEPGSIALGSVKSNIGHLKAAAGAAGLFKMVMQLHERVLVPSLGFHDPNPNVDWDHLPFSVNAELRDWPADSDGARRGGVSAFGFGGTNFHAVLEEYVPGLHRDRSVSRTFASAEVPVTRASAVVEGLGAAAPSATPLRGAVVLGGNDDSDLVAQLEQLAADAADGRTPPSKVPDPETLALPVRVAVDYADSADLAAKAGKAVKAFGSGSAAMWKMLRAQGVFVGRGPAPKAAFLYTGQGSQYVNMLKTLRAEVPVVADTFAEADRIMTPVLGRPLTSYIFIDETDPDAVRELEQQLTRTEITQPAILTADLALTRLLGTYGMRPDMVMGHSLGEYGALVAAGAMTFGAALEAVSARGHEMASISVADNGAMAAVFGPLDEIDRVVASVDSGVVVANINSLSQGVIGGPTEAVERAVEVFLAEGINAIRIPVSHAFHTSIVAPASEPLKQALRRLDLTSPTLPIVSNVTGDFYPMESDREAMVDLLGRQVASPVQFVRGLRTLYDAGARVFVEVGPKKALHGFVEDVLHEHDDVLALFTNHPKNGDVAAVNAALCGLWAAGLGAEASGTQPVAPEPVTAAAPAVVASAPSISTPETGSTMNTGPLTTDTYAELGHLFAGVLEQGLEITGRGDAGVPPSVAAEPVVITGAALGLPGVPKVFDDGNLQRILEGQQFIDTVPQEFRAQQVDLHITRLVKRESGDPTFEAIDDEAEVVKLAGRHAPLDVVEQFGIDPARDAALDSVTRLAIGAGFDAMRDAGLPLVMRYKTTSVGSKLPERWGLPDSLRDDTGVIFASAFPGYTSFAHDLRCYYTDRGRREQLLALEAVRSRMQGDEPACAETDRRIAELRGLLESEPFSFDRRFLFRCLSMGHSQFAEIIGARGPNTQINAACASTTQALSLAEDWIRAGRCRRVVVVSADDVTGDELLPWVTAGFLASGAAATDDSVEDAAIPFDRRRHGMIVGMGAAAFVVEAAGAARERGLQPICEVLGAVTANSAFHGTRLDIDHIAQMMETVVGQAERRGVDRHEIAASTVFVSHETYTPARGGSASAEINALRATFGPAADSIVIANTKGFTGHAMGAGIEDVVAIKALETGVVPPVPNFKEPDPELGELNLSQGGSYPVRHALRLAAGFGSQIAMSLLRWTPLPDGRHRSPSELGYAYRITDPEAWQRWLDSLGGGPGSSLEVNTRRLRVVDRSAPATESTPEPRTEPVTPVAEAAPAPVEPAPASVEPASASVEPAPAPAEPVPAAVVAAAGPSDEEVSEAVVSIVAEMTGYPPELLDLDLDLEADLGVDTVKQAEVFAAVRERFGVERDESLSLREFPTLAHVIGWVRDKTASTSAAAEAAAPAPAAAAPVVETVLAGSPAAGPSDEEVSEAVVSIVAEMTGYPPELLDLDLDLEADLGVDTVKQAEVFAAVRERFGVERDESLSLREFPTLAHVIGWVRDKTASTSAAAEAAAPAPAAAAPVVETVLAGSPAAGPSDEEVSEAVVSIVAEMTGYPPELLDLDLDLEADLGVDTVKQAEVFAAVRERFGVERDESLSLREFPTLAHVIGWVRDKTASTSAAAEAAAPAPAAAAPVVETVLAGSPAAGPSDEEVSEAVVSIVAEMTGYPPELLDLDLDLEADLGVDTVKQAEVFAAVRERFGVERDESLSLREFPTLAHVIGWVRDKTASTSAAAEAAAPAPAAAAPVVETVLAGSPAAGPSDEEVSEAVVSIVAEMTGYPPELLDLDLDLEADLGVDTVKQAEVFAAVRERFGVERDESLSLREFPTLAHVIGWVRDKTASTSAAAEAAAPAPAAAAPVVETVLAGSPAAGPSDEEVSEAVVSIVAEMTGYPPELLDLDLDLEADLGVDTVKQAEVFAAVRERFGVERDESLSLREFPTLAHVIGWVRDKTATPAVEPSSAPAAPVVATEAAVVADSVAGSPAAGPSDEEVSEAVVSIVAEMTGYPPELLDLDLDLEADLGVDTVKQAEVFAAVRERFGVERDESLSLREFPTLAHVIGWVRGKTASTTDAAVPAPDVEAAGPTPASGLHLTTVVGDLDAVDALPRREPLPVLRPALERCLPTGVVLGRDTRVVMMRDAEGGVAAVLQKGLADLGVTVLSLDPGRSTEQILATVDAWRVEGEIAGVYWLPALDDEGPLDSLTLADVQEGLRRRVKALYAVMRRLYDDQPFLVAGTRLGGFHGYDAAGATAPLGGAVTGFAKSYKRERPGALVKAVDVSLETEAQAVADLLVSETKQDPGCVEVGYADGRRWGVGLAARPFPPQGATEKGTTPLGPDSVVVVTGAAGSIVAAVTADLARAAGGGTFHLLDLTPEPDPADPDLRTYVADRDGFKALLAARMREQGLRPTPVAIEKELAGFERLAAAMTAIDAVRDAGGRVHYHSVDLTDPAAVAQVVDRVRDSDGRIDLLVHAAGVEVSRALPAKEPREFDLVHGVKADGWFNVMKAARDLPIGATVVFSSVAGRFGNAGQCDYAAANDLLCKITSSMRRTRPETRALAVDWTAWGGIGMATRGSIPKIMELAGVEMLPPEAGVAWIRRELTGHAFRGEVVAAGALGRMADGYHPTGGVEPADLTSWGSEFAGEVAEADLLDGLVVRTTLDPTAQPFLNDHRIDGTAVLPGVMGMEFFAEVAGLLTPELYVVAVEDVDFLVPVKFFRDEPRTLTVTARVRPEGGDLLAECRLEAERVLPGSETPQRTVHFTGSVRLSSIPSPSDHATPLAKARGTTVIAPSDVYRLYFHGPAYQVVGEAWQDGGAAVGRLAEHLPADQVPAVDTLLVPRLEELCFQVAGLWEAGREGRLALPAHVDRLSVLGDVATARGGALVAIARPMPGSTGAFDCQVLDPEGRVLLRLDGYRTVPMPGPLAEDVRSPFRAVLA